ncbi:MAG TPA: hypothetical protein PKL13_02970 [bacterium]|nr:hypothetical protein [bacterium]
MKINSFEKTIKIIGILIIIILFLEIGIVYYINNKNKNKEEIKKEIKEKLEEGVQNTIEKSDTDQSIKTPATDKSPKTSLKEIDPSKIKAPQIPQR